MNWKAQYGQDKMDPRLIASYMKMLFRGVPDGLINKTLQSLLIYLMQGGRCIRANKALEGLSKLSFLSCFKRQSKD